MHNYGLLHDVIIVIIVLVEMHVFHISSIFHTDYWIRNSVTYA